MSYLLPQLHTGWHVDQAILSESDRIVAIRFGRPHTPACMVLDEILAGTAELLRNMAVIYVVDTDEVPDFSVMYELNEDFCLMFFYRNKHILVDAGTGNNNKVDFELRSKQEFIDIVEVVYRAARKGKGLAMTTVDFSLRKRADR